MHTEEIIFEVAKPPAEVWARLVDMERAPDWVDNMQSSKRRGSGPTGVGTVFDQVVEMNGSSNQAELRVTVFDECSIFAHEGESGPASFQARFELKSTAQGTNVVHTISVTLSGVMRMMESMIGGWVNKNARESVLNLKRLIEAGQ